MSLFEGAVVAVVAWGVLAFGSTYPWAYWPLAVASAGVGIAGLASGSPRQHQGRALIAAFAVVIAAMLIQIVPLPASLVSTISPGREPLASLVLPRSTDGNSALPLSIAPAYTARAVVLFAAFSVFAFGVSRRLGERGVIRVATAIAALGLLVALLGIIGGEWTGFDGLIYGLWPTRFNVTAFGPFPNRNHFGGWMLMAALLTLGLAVGLFVERARSVRQDWRHRVLWLSSRQASECVLLGLTGLVMVASLLMTMSRSSIVSYLTAVLIVGAWGMYRRGNRFVTVASSLVAVIFFAIAVNWTGTEALETRFNVRERDINTRAMAWQEAKDLAGRFSATGTGMNTYWLASYGAGNTARSRFNQAHNDYLQVAAEGGALVGVPLAALTAVVVWNVWRRFGQDANAAARWIRIGAIAGVIAIGLQEVVEFSLQMPGNAALFAVLIGIAVRDFTVR